MNSQRGFSLLETLAALALLALLLLGVVGSLETLTRSTRSGLAASQRLDEVRAAQIYLRQTLSGAVPYPWAQGPKGFTVIRGTGDAVTFVAPGPGYLAHEGLQLQRLAFVGEGESRHLEVAFAPMATREAAQVVPSSSEVVLDHVVSGHFVYSGLDADKKPVTWQSTWPYEDHLPIMVGVEVTLSNGTRWATLTVPLRMDMNATNAQEALARLSSQAAK